VFFHRILTDVKAWRVLLEHGWACAVQQFKIDETFIDRDVRTSCEAAHEAWHTRRRIIRRLRLSLVLSVVTISICICALPFALDLADMRGLARIVLATAVLLSVGCLALYAWLIWGIATQKDTTA
jgi:hypothetical protein